VAAARVACGVLVEEVFSREVAAVVEDPLDVVEVLEVDPPTVRSA
jgi:hypothetical protein